MKWDIPEPCPEPWETMEVREGGRYCARCQHVVTDLTGMTRRQAEKIVKRAGDDLCIVPLYPYVDLCPSDVMVS